MDTSKRSDNYSAAETEVLVTEVLAAESILFDKFSSSLDSTKKAKKWLEIHNKVNACGTTQGRSLKQIKKKWQDLKKIAKKKEAARLRYARGTGGGPPPKELTPIDEKILSVIPECVVEGIEGGIDSLQSNGQDPPSTSTDNDIYGEEAPEENFLVEEAAQPDSGTQTKGKKRPAATFDDRYLALEEEKLNVHKDILEQLRKLVDIQHTRLQLDLSSGSMPVIDPNIILNI